MSKSLKHHHFGREMLIRSAPLATTPSSRAVHFGAEDRTEWVENAPPEGG